MTDDSDPKAQSLAYQSVIRLLRITICEERVARYKAEYNHASTMLERSKLQLVLAQRENRTGQSQLPLNAEAAVRYFAEQDGTN